MQKEDLSRLLEEHAKAIQTSREKIEKCEQFKADYEALQARLFTLPDEVSHDVMVPFGKFAFMPGQLYHTNEVLVLLGDNWFVKRSTKQALEITERRKKYVTEMLEKERKQIQDWENRYAFTKGFRTVVEEHKDTVEIKEEYSPQRESGKKVRKAWVPKGNVPPPRRVYPTTQPSKEKLGTSTTTSLGTASSRSNRGGGRVKSDPKDYVPTSINVVDSSAHTYQELPKDQELWRKLEDLRVQEEKKNELEESNEERETGLSGTTGKPKEGSRHVDRGTAAMSSSEPGLIKHPAIEVSAPIKSQYSSQTVTNKDEKILATPPLRIAVTHASPSRQQTSGPGDMNIVTRQQTSGEEPDKPLFTSPADIFTRFVKHDSDSDLEQLGDITKVTDRKEVKWEPDLVSYSDDTKERKKDKVGLRGVSVRSGDPSVSKKSASTRPQLPFTGQVIERTVPKHTSTTAGAEKKTSRFKAARQERSKFKDTDY